MCKYILGLGRKCECLYQCGWSWLHFWSAIIQARSFTFCWGGGWEGGCAIYELLLAVKLVDHLFF